MDCCLYQAVADGYLRFTLHCELVSPRGKQSLPVGKQSFYRARPGLKAQTSSIVNKHQLEPERVPRVRLILRETRKEGNPLALSLVSFLLLFVACREPRGPRETR